MAYKTRFIKAVSVLPLLLPHESEPSMNSNNCKLCGLLFLNHSALSQLTQIGIKNIIFLVESQDVFAFFWWIFNEIIHFLGEIDV